MRKDLPCCSPVTRKTGTTKTLSVRLLMVMYLLAGTFIISNGQLAGTAPVNPPIGGMKIDGWVERQSAGIGDWTAGDAPLNGAGTYVFHPTTGAPLLVMSYHLLDLWNDQVSDDIFDGGNKLFQDPNTWGWRSQKPPAKDDIHNVGVLLSMSADGHIWLCISGDRLSTNGTSYLDFELYKNPIFKIGGPLTGGFNSTGPNGGRTIGDLSITLEYTAGGSFANVSFLKWRNVSETEFDYVDTIPPAGSAFAAANGQVIDVPYGAFGETTYQPLQFIEGAIDITRLIGAISDPAECGRLPFASLFVKTKSSAERTADLKDFVSPLQLNVCFDRTKPTFTSCPPGSNLGCNPAGLPLPGGAVASDNCGVVTVSSSDGMVQVNGCQRTQVRTYLAEDACGNTEICTQTFTWTVDTEGPTITITGGNLNPGCNPASINFGSASASDNCGGAVTLTSTAGSITTTGCTRTQTMTWNASGGCSQTSSTSRTATWTVDVTPPTISITGGNLNPGCNPASINFGSASGSDNCGGAVTVTSTAGSITTTGCTRTQTMTFNAVDGCTNASSTTRTATWTVDVTPPSITITGGNLNPGCNPASIDFGSASASDNCGGAVTLTSTAGSITTTGCTRTQTMTWNAVDGCTNASSTSRTATWTVDVTPPSITITGGNLNPGCNPASINFGSASASDNCGGAVTLTSTAGSITTTGCTRTQTMTFNAVDGCTNASSTTRTATWTVDVTPPSITITGGNLNPGCNPASIDFGSASASDNCGGAVALTSTAGSITTTGCSRTQTMTWNAVDGCTNASSTSRTATWTVDVTPPSITITGGNLNPGCNPASIDFGSASASDNCGGAVTLTSTAGSITTTGCTRTQTMTWNAVDGCTNASSTSRTATWTVDVTPPSITITGGNLNPGCNPASINFGSASASDNCGGAVTLTSTAGSITTTGCTRTQTMTWNAVDGCTNASSTSRTATWTVDVTPPSITITGGNLNPGCNPASINFGSASASDNCGGAVTLTSTAGSITTTGCTRTQTMTWNAVDGCTNASSTSRTATWTVDVTPPSITITGGNLNPGCNPASIDFGSASASDNCGGAVTLTSTAGSITTTGCTRTQTMTWNAVDGCTNASSTSRTATWTVDVTPPSITITGGNLNPGCNPASINFGSASASDNCGGAVTLTSTAGSITTTGCSRTQTMTWNAVDGCTNASSTTRTATWTVDVTPPSITITGGNLNPGCNPASIDFGSASASDNCGGAVTLTSTAGSITTTGCSRTQTMTWNAVDGCTNASSTTRTATWTVDVTPPSITITGGNLNPGCNPASINFGSASASDNCGGAVTLTSTAGSITTTGCSRTQTMTWNAVDGCTNASSTTRTATWTVDVTPPSITITGGNLNPGCNPASINFGSASASDNCGGAVTLTSTAGSITTTGCTRTQTMTWNAVDGCTNASSTSRTATWTVDVTPPSITITGGNLNPGCNPASIDFGSASASDNCGGAVTLTSTAGSITTTGCTRTQTMTWNAVDGCTNASSTTRTATWTVDVTPPSITITGGNLNPGCNPASIDFGSASASDNCGGAVTLTSTAGSITTTGCTRTQTMTWNAVDGCTNASSTSRTATWTVDVTPPSITITGGNLNPGCNPASINFGSASASDNCGGAVTLTSTAGSITTTGCTRTQTMTWNAVDGCTNASSTSRTATWTVDVTPPSITITGGNLNPGCNPASIDFGSASASDNCGGAVTLTSTAGSITTTGCSRTQTMTWNAVDGCTNASSTTRTATWTVDVTPPSITITGGNLNPGCNPASIDFGSASASDNCGGAVTLTSTAGSITTTGCSRTQTMTWNAVDGCTNASSTSRTATWTVDVTPPSITITGGNLNPGCNPASINFGSASASDNCGGAVTLTSTAGSITTTGCTRTQTMTWNAVDGCTNASSTSRTATWTVDVTPPSITITGGNLNPGCNPASIDFGSASASDNCGGAVTLTSTAGSITTTGCIRTQTMTWNAVDGCTNASSTSRTATWTVDVTPPTISVTGGNLNPGCNPASIDFGSASASDNCGGAVTLTSTAGSITTTGCTRTQTMTWNAVDGCTNASSTSRTATWTVDVTPPSITITGGNLNPGCNPASINFGSASASDNCGGAVTLTSTAGSITTTGCTRTQTMTWNAVDGCTNASSTSRTATWTVDVTPPSITITGGNLNPGCNPASINFGSASASDNCGGAVTLTSTAGSITTTGCTRTQTMTWNAVDGCTNASSTSRTATWTVDVTPPVFTNPPASVDLECSASIPSVPTVTATDNCGGTPGVVYNGQTDNPSNCQTGFQRIIVRTWTATDACGNTAVHTQTIRVKCCVPICTLTQGGYGQYGGNICLPNGTTVRQHEIMVTALDAAPGDSVVFGKQSNNRYWVINLGDVNQGANSNILKMLPGGGGSFVLGTDTYSNAPKYSNTPSWPVAPLQPNGSQAGKIRNTLLAQTITFYFNTTIAGSGLGSLILNGDSAIISDRVCGSFDPVPGTRDTVEIISPTIVSYMASHGYPATAAGLLQLANDALGGVNVSPLSLSEIAGAVDRINNVFDNCVLFEGYVRYVSSARVSTSQVRQALPANELNVTAFPNPYEEQNFSLRINAPVSGQATIEFFTIDGQKISEIKRTVVANRDEVVTFKVPGLQKSKIAYVVNVGKYNSKGIVLSPN